MSHGLGYWLGESSRSRKGMYEYFQGPDENKTPEPKAGFQYNPHHHHHRICMHSLVLSLWSKVCQPPPPSPASDKSSLTKLVPSPVSDRLRLFVHFDFNFGFCRQGNVPTQRSFCVAEERFALPAVVRREGGEIP